MSTTVMTATCFCGSVLELEVPEVAGVHFEPLVRCPRCSEAWAVAAAGGQVVAQVKITDMDGEELARLPETLALRTLPAVLREQIADPRLFCYALSVAQARLRWMSSDPWGQRITRWLDFWPLRWLDRAPFDVGSRLFHRFGLPEHLEVDRVWERFSGEGQTA